MRPPSITLRIALLFAGASGVILMAAGLWISAMLVAHFEAQDRLEIRGKLELVRRLIESKRSPADFERLPTELARALVGHQELGVLLLDGHGDTLFASIGDRLAETLQSHPLPVDAPVEFTDSERGYRGMGLRIDSGLPEPGVLTVGVLRDTSHHEYFLAALRHALWLAIAVTALMMGALGWFVARSGLAPLRRLTEHITAIDPERLAERLPTEAVAPELLALAGAFNGMLQRLEDGYRRLSEFSSDIAHELRTPLANLRTQAEVSLGKSRSPNEYRELLHSALEEYERLSRMVDDMLLLAKTDEGHLPDLRLLDLDAEVAALIEYFEALAEDRQLVLAATGSARLWGDGPMLRRAIANLLSNAIRHAERGSTIRVAIDAATPDGARLTVTNRGPEIPSEALPRLFDRFYRSDPARSRDGEGSGLGLAIARSIVRAHGGDIRVRSEAGETAFECRFSRSAVRSAVAKGRERPRAGADGGVGTRPAAEVQESASSVK
ncbi:MAG: heavy metal sensor histidine kinase [Rhodocyclaceae bacterium]|nr:heavy metal sensor histidine kinase [Rhodocyclaceae bacterium]